MATIFFSYRREDSAAYAGRLYDRLQGEFGSDSVFIDIDALQPGDDFVEAIGERLNACDLMLAIIGPRWIAGPGDKRRLEDEGDYVRLEIQTAIERRIRIMPVLVGGATMPRPADLPEPLHPLLRRQAIELSDTRWKYDVGQLVAKIKGATAVTSSAPESTEDSGRQVHIGQTEAQSEPALSSPTRRGWFVLDVLRAARLDSRVYEAAAKDGARMTQRSIAVVVLAGLVSGCVAAIPLVLDTFSNPLAGSFRPLSHLAAFLATASVGITISWAASLWICWAYLSYWAGTKLLARRTTPAEVARGLAFALTPLAATGLGLGLIPGAATLPVALTVVGFGWTLAAGTVALRKSLGIQPLNAVLAAAVSLGGAMTIVRAGFNWAVSGAGTADLPSEAIVESLSESLGLAVAVSLAMSVLGTAYTFRRTFSRRILVSGLAAGLMVGFSFVAVIATPFFRPDWIVYSPTGLIRTIALADTANSSSAAVAPDGRRLAMGALGDDRRISMLDLESGEVVRRLQGHTCCPNGAVTSVAFSRDGKLMASAADENAIRLWNTETGVVLRTMPALNVESVAFSPDGRRLASGSLDGPVKVWDVERGQQLYSLEATRGRINAVSFSPNGLLLAAATGTPLAVETNLPDDFSVRLWNAQDGKLAQTLLGHSYEVRSIAFSPDGLLLASASWDQSMRVWQVSTGQQIRLETTFQAAEAVAFSPDGREVAWGLRDGTIEVWDAGSWKRQVRFSAHEKEIRFLAFTPDDSRLITADGRRLRVWSLEALLPKSVRPASSR